MNLPIVRSDVLILGAGVLGVSLAYHLKARGISATVLEREGVAASHASGKNAGMMRQLYRSAQLTSWTTRSLATWPRELKERRFTPGGSLVVGRHNPGHHDELFEERVVAGPNGPLPAVYTASDGLLDSPGFVQDLLQYSRGPNTRVFLKRTARLERFASEWIAFDEDQAAYSAPVVAVCAGAWVNRLFEGALSSLAIPAEPYARHLFLVDGWSESFMPYTDAGFVWDEEHSWYLRKWSKHERLVSLCDKGAATPESFAPRPDLGEELAVKLMNAVPSEASNLRLSRSWHCFRTYTSDQLPIWGEDPAAPGLFWLAAFGGFGMSTGFAASHDAAEYIATGRHNVSAECLIDRFRSSASTVTEGTSPTCQLPASH